jgi:hypothetical protein
MTFWKIALEVKLLAVEAIENGADKKDVAHEVRQGASCEQSIAKTNVVWGKVGTSYETQRRTPSLLRSRAINRGYRDDQRCRFEKSRRGNHGYKGNAQPPAKPDIAGELS